MHHETPHLTPLDSETAELFLDRIVDQANPYNHMELANVNTQDIARQLTDSAQRVTGTLLARYVEHMDYDKLPKAERTVADMEDTQEMPLPGIDVLVKTVRLSADPSLVPFGEDPRNYPRGIRELFLAEVIE